MALTSLCLVLLGNMMHGVAVKLAHHNQQLEIASLASSAASVVDPEEHEAIRKSGETFSGSYNSALNPLKRVQRNSELAAIYTLYEQDGKVKFGYDTTRPGDNNGDGVEDHSSVNEEFPAAEVPPQAMRAFREKVTTFETEPTKDKWGTWVSAFAPVFNADGSLACVVGVDVDYSRYLLRLSSIEQRKYEWYGISFLLALVAGIGTGALIKQLSRSLGEAIASQDELNKRNKELASLNATLDRQASTDSLTGLLNRSAMESATFRALDKMASDPAWCVAVVFIDLDNFKLVNDSLGHEAGDFLLNIVTGHLEDVADGQTVGRFGGDELMVLVQGPKATDRAIEIARDALKRLAAPVHLHGKIVYPTASIGIAAASGIDHSTSDLIRRADAAMYAAKHRGKNQIAVFQSTMMEQVDQRLSLEAGLRDAYENKHLWTALQPIIEMGTGRVASCEALLRWTTADGTNISPADFIPVAEENGMILQIGERVLDDMVSLLATWKHIPALREIKIAVNVSARQICDPEFMDRVIRRLEKHDVPGSRLTLEITETAVMNDHASLVGQLLQAKDHGISIALDDFGTGFSSLSMLVKTPIDILKIDKTFILDLACDRRTNVMTRSIVALSQAMGMKVVAEGVERPEHANHLREFGCELAQGWLYARAMPIPDFVDFVTSQQEHVAA